MYDSETFEKTILLVAMPGSIHVVRWIKQLGDQGLDVHLFPSTGGVIIHPEMEGVTFIHRSFRAVKLAKHKSVQSARFFDRAVVSLRNCFKKSAISCQVNEHEVFEKSLLSS